MLFDLRGRGRRRTVRVLYTGLALLMGIGLVGFGVGGGFGGGGIFTGLNSNNETGTGGATYTAQIKKYRKLTQEQPKNVARLGKPDQDDAQPGGQRSLRHECRGGHLEKGGNCSPRPPKPGTAISPSTPPTRTSRWPRRS